MTASSDSQKSFSFASPISGSVRHSLRRSDKKRFSFKQEKHANDKNKLLQRILCILATFFIMSNIVFLATAFAIVGRVFNKPVDEVKDKALHKHAVNAAIVCILSFLIISIYVVKVKVEQVQVAILGTLFLSMMVPYMSFLSGGFRKSASERNAVVFFLDLQVLLIMLVLFKIIYFHFYPRA